MRACSATLLAVSNRDAPPPVQPPAAQAPAANAPQSDEQHARVTCGGGHPFPPPDILPRSAWRDAFVRMHFLREQRLPPVGPPGTLSRVLLPPDMETTLPYFLSRAPERLPPPDKGIQSRWASRGTPRWMSATSTATARPISWWEISSGKPIPAWVDVWMNRGKKKR